MGDGMKDATCETCRFWSEPGTERVLGSADDETFEWSRGAARTFKNPPHANLLWRQCKAAPEGFEDDVDRSVVKMAVFDGSGYAASLYTRSDHFCGEWKPREVTG